MAGKGGGSWKVAYADFVTAMMAFFLVMWICAQDQSVKSSVANYFSRTDPFGTSRKPGRTGSVFQSQTSGNTPNEDSVAMGRGRVSYTSGSDRSPATRLVSDWIHNDEKILKYWQEQAHHQRETATLAAVEPDEAKSSDEVTKQRLARQLKSEITLGMPSQPGSLYQDLIFETLQQVNWTELAEDMLGND